MIAKDKLGIALTLSGLVCILVSSIMYGGKHLHIFGYNIYYLGIAFAFPLLFSAVTTLISKHTKFTASVCFVAIWLSVTNVYTELFGDPTIFSIKEVVCAYGGCILIICLIYKYWDNANNR